MAIRQRKRNKGDNPALEMTPMIDVVFQLLIFFIVAIKEEDILARLNAARPAPSPPPDEIPPDPPEFIDIEISKNAVLFMKQKLAVNLMRPVPSYEQLDKDLATQARFGKDATVTIRCTKDSSHGVLVQVLDLCAKNGLTQLRIFSI